IIDLFGVGANDHVVQYALDATGWHWFDLGAVPANRGGGKIVGPLTATSRLQGPWALDVFGVGNDGHVVQFALNAAGWQWFDLGAVPPAMSGGGLSGPLTAVTREQGSEWLI